MKSQGDRLKAVREMAGYKSGREAALANNWKLSTYSAHEAGRRKMGDDDAEKYARRFGSKGVTVTARWILWGDGNDQPLMTPLIEPPLDLRFAPVLGVAKAGTWVEVDDSMQTEFEPVPYVPTAYKNAEQFAYKISGNAMDRRGVLNGDYVVCVPYSIARPTPQHGDVVVIRQLDGQKVEVSCRIMSASNGSFDLLPSSNDPRFHPVIIPVWDEMMSAAGAQVEIVGLVVGKYTPF